jgi:hypothetical protein
VVASQKSPEQPFRTLQIPERFRLGAYPVNPHAAASKELKPLGFARTVRIRVVEC